MSQIDAILPVTAGFREPGGVNAKPSTPAASFAGELQAAVSRIEAAGTENAEMIGRLLRGENVELHTVALRTQEAQTSFELFLQVRNKLIQGYQEIMRIQV